MLYLPVVADVTADKSVSFGLDSQVYKPKDRVQCLWETGNVDSGLVGRLGEDGYVFT